jgi:hypothetical protein
VARSWTRPSTCSSTVSPGTTPVYPQFRALAIIKMINNVLKQNKNYSLSLMNINQACFCMLDKLVPDWYKESNNPNLTGWDVSMPIRYIIDQLNVQNA